MEPITFDHAGPGEKFYRMPSGRIIKVCTCQPDPHHTGEVRFGFLAVLCDENGQETAQADRYVERTVDVGGIQQGTASLEPEFWRPWSRRKGAANAAYPEPPDDLREGETRTVDGQRLRGVMVRPSDDEGDLGDFAVRLTDGQVFRKRIGELENLCRVAAREFEARLDSEARISALGLPRSLSRG